MDLEDKPERVPQDTDPVISPSNNGTAEALAQNSEGQLWPCRAGASGSTRCLSLGQSRRRWCPCLQGMCCGSAPALPTGGSKQNEWCQRMWTRLTASSQWFCREKSSNHPLHKRSRSWHFLYSSSYCQHYRSFSFLQKLPWMALTGFISIRALSFLTRALAVWTISPSRSPCCITPSVGFLFIFVFVQDLLVHPFRPPSVFFLAFSFLGWIDSERGGGDLWRLTSFIGLLPLGFYPMILYQADLWRGHSLLSWNPG